MNFGYRNLNNIVHRLRRQVPTGHNGTDYVMFCGVTYVSHESWDKPEEGLAPTCLRCVAASNATTSPST